MGGAIFLGVFAFLALTMVLLTIKIIPQSEIGIVERLGKYHRTLPAGLNMVFPFIDKVAYRPSLRTQRLDSEPQPVITADNVSMMIDTVTFYKISDPFKATYEIDNLHLAIQAITNTTLRDVIGSMELDATLSSRDDINKRLRAELDKATDVWGVKIERVEVKNINPPQSIDEAMQQQMKAERQKRASILEAEGKKESSIREAEGAKQSQILEAEGLKESQVLKAEGEAQAIERLASAEKVRVSLIYKALKEADIDENILNLESIKAMQEIAKSDNKMVVPYESQNLMGAFSALKEIK